MSTWEFSGHPVVWLRLPGLSSTGEELGTNVLIALDAVEAVEPGYIGEVVRGSVVTTRSATQYAVAKSVDDIQQMIMQAPEFGDAQ